MKRMLSGKKFLGIAIISALLIVIVFAYKEYHRQPVNVARVKADVTVNASNLMQAFEENENAANERYLGKVIEVNGTVHSVINQGDTLINIYLDATATGKISCLIDDSYMKQGQKVVPGIKHTIRGICTGYLLDVELNQCAIIQ